MICVGYFCDECKHKRPKYEGWKPACDAFPTGIPWEYITTNDMAKLKECNDGIGFEPKEERIE